MRKLSIVFIVAAQLLTSPAIAACVHKGKTYMDGEQHNGGGKCVKDRWQCKTRDGTYAPIGTNAGAVTCQPDGTWG